MNGIRYVIASTDEDLLQILALQKANLKHSLTRKEMKSEGFVTVSHTLDLLRAMNLKCPHILAKSGNQVVGYALCMHPDFRNEIEVLKPMFSQIDQALPRSESYLIMGQICIAKPFRKQGLFRGLYKKMQAVTQNKFSSIITEVDHRNQRSLNAHYAAGFRDLVQYSSQGRTWHLISLE